MDHEPNSFQCFVCGSTWDKSEPQVRFYVRYHSEATGGEVYVCKLDCLERFAQNPRIDFNQTVFV